MMNFNNIINNLPTYLLRIPVILISLSAHEAAHGYVAYKFGDYTPKITGRITLNPLKHLDPIGAICLLIFGFGWAKPVMVNFRNFKKPKRDMALTALAGPLANLILGFLGMFIWILCFRFFPENNLTKAIIFFLEIFYMLNIGLAVFNLLPIPPLDGSRIFFQFLPDKIYYFIMQYEKYIMIIMFVLLFLGVLDNVISFLVRMVAYGMFRILFWLLPFVK